MLKVLKRLSECSVQCCITSPPYWGLRDYGVPGQLGLESTPEEYVSKMVEVFREVRRVLRDDGTLWLNLGDSYASHPQNDKLADPKAPRRTPFNRCRTNAFKAKDLIGIPWMVAFALRADGWYLRADIIWEKPNAMPESVTDRPTKSHEYVFLLSKSERYYYDADAIREPFTGTERKTGQQVHGEQYKKAHGDIHRGLKKAQPNPNGRNKRTVWTVTTRPFKGAHFAVFPPKLIEPCIMAGSRPGDIVIDPFGGAGTTTLQAMTHDRDSIYIDLNPEYLNIALERLGFGENQPRLLEYHTHEIIKLDEIKDIKMV